MSQRGKRRERTLGERPGDSWRRSEIVPLPEDLLRCLLDIANFKSS